MTNVLPAVHEKLSFSRKFQNICRLKPNKVPRCWGRGDGMYKDKFREILLNQCEQLMALRDLGSRFVQTVTRLMELLLEYR